MLRIVRTFKVDILTLFLTLNILSITCIITFSYLESYKAITRFSTQSSVRVGEVAANKIAIAGQQVEDILNKTAIFFLKNDLNPENQYLIDYMLNVLSYNADISAFFLATENGNSVIIKKLGLMSQTHYISDPNKPLPEGTAYLVGIIDLNRKENPEIWYYKDAKFNTIGLEKLSQLSIYTKQRPWYVGAAKAKTLYWTDFYSFSSDEKGVTAAKPIFDNQGRLLGVIGADLSDISFVQLVSFLKLRSGGRSGNIYVLNQRGNILVPNQKILDKQPEETAVLIENYNRYIKTKQNFFFVENKSGQKELFYITKAPKNFGNDWLIAIVAPFGDFFGQLLKAQTISAIIAFLVLITSLFIIMGFAKKISSPIIILANEIDKVKNLEFGPSRRVYSLIKEIKLIDESVVAMKTALRSFTRYVPKEIVKELLQQGKEIALEGEKREVTILFSDIKDFTAIAEKNSAETLMDLLAQYFDGLSKIILKNKGTIDKYMGDGIMAFWGAPRRVRNHAVLACLTALRCQAYLTEFNKNQESLGRPVFITRIGINTGKVIVGNVGTLERMNYTMIGDAVNTASRLENLDKIYHVMIMISEEVHKKIGDLFLVRPLDQVAVKGKDERIKVYELVASLTRFSDIMATPEQIEFCELFTRAYSAFEEKDFENAKKIFMEIHTKFPDDFPTQLYLQRIANY